MKKETVIKKIERIKDLMQGSEFALSNCIQQNKDNPFPRKHFGLTVQQMLENHLQDYKDEIKFLERYLVK